VSCACVTSCRSMCVCVCVCLCVCVCMLRRPIRRCSAISDIRHPCYGVLQSNLRPAASMAIMSQ